MKSASQRHRPRFLWQAALILLPVAVLSVLGMWALQRDRAATEQQVRTRAESLANATLADLAEILRPIKVTEDQGALDIRLTGKVFAFAVGSTNDLIWPTPVDWPPQPDPLPADLSGILRSNKLDQWREAEAAFAKDNWPQATELYLAFLNGRRRLETNVMADIESGIGGTLSGGGFAGSLRYRSLALFRRGNAFEQLGRTREAVEAYDDALAAQGNGSAHSEAGLPWAHLAALKILDLAQDDFSHLPADWRTNPLPVLTKFSYDASPFEAELLRRLQKLKPELSTAEQPNSFLTSTFDQWERDVESRRLYAEAAAVRAGDPSPWPVAFWVQGQVAWLALAEGAFRNLPNLQTARRYFAVLSEAHLSTALAEFVEREDRMGDFAVRLEVGGRTLTERDLATANWRSRANTFTAVSAEFPLSVTATLADPPAFFAGQRRRQRLFSALLLAAAATCAVACFSAHRTFQRQLQLNETKSNFVSSVSHELRAPIASVRLLAESLERGKVETPGKQREYFGFIVQECRRLSSLIENVLDFSRIEEGRKQYDIEPTDLRALAVQTVKLMESYATEKGVKLQFELGTSNTEHRTPNIQRKTETGNEAEPEILDLERRTLNFEIKADGKALQQALVNLIDNALKHSPKGGKVTVGLEAVAAVCDRRSKEPDGEQSQTAATISLFVEDHGPGIPPEEHERIFERFYRRGSELRRETQGVGIGLSIVKHIVEAHGGRVTVQSAVSQGSRFGIELPVKR